jgi:2-phospho-L-lactate guanylyltransferase
LTAPATAVIPIKGLANVKRRLAARLRKQERAALVLRLLARELEVLSKTAGIERIIVVTSEQRVAAFAEMRGAVVALEPDDGVNSAVQAGLARAYAAGACRVLALHGDLPFVEVSDITALLKASAPGVLALAPDRRQRGTNAVVVQRGMELGRHFGVDSYRRFVHAAAANGLEVRAVARPGLGFDLDVPADLMDYRMRLGRAVETRSKAALR